ncbi:MAG TPA: glutamine-hydrolyzing GMP synthase, partial [Candidatus Nitrosocosmicus sp.]|nr:glutamine-hydrolyzing GMP synthase [Candidatus Nitrosocosmicus sp.]
MILIIDFGSQTTHLISRRLKEYGVKSTIINPDQFNKRNSLNYNGIILSGGPSSVYDKNSPQITDEVFDVGIPVLGICYGQQLIAHMLGGEVTAGKKKEYGPAELEILDFSELYKSDKTTPIADRFMVWMSHGDEVNVLPKGFITLAKSNTIPHASIANVQRMIYGVQFHPEVIHTQFGEQILKNFIRICGLVPHEQEVNQEIVNQMIQDVKDSVRDKKAICALSGGVDSSVAAVLVHNAIGHNITAIYIDSGLMRQDETKTLRKVFKQDYKMNIKIVNAAG